MDPYEAVNKLVCAHFAFFEEKRTLFSILFFVRGALHQDLENPYVREMQSNYERYMNFLSRTLDTGLKKGAFRPIDPINQAYVLHGIIVGFISQWIINERKGSVADKAGLVADTFLHGIVSQNKKADRKDSSEGRRRAGQAGRQRRKKRE